MTFALELTSGARADIAAILATSAEGFGLSARDRYAALIAAAFADLRTDPFRFGSTERTEVRDGLRSYHLRQARHRAADAGARVGRPRHLIAYVVAGDRVVVLRVLHDAMELSGRIEAGDG